MINRDDLRAILELMRECDGVQARYSVAAVKRIIMPAVEAGQYQVEPKQWFATWAFFSPQQVMQFLDMKPIPGDWMDRPGTTLWLIDLVTHPSVDRATLVPHLMRAEWMTKTQHQFMFYARSYGTSSFKRVGRIARRYDGASQSAH